MTTHKGTEQPAEGLYTRTMHGTRPRYTLAYSHVNDYHIVDVMPVNTFRLVHAYGEGGRRYHYDVTPDTAAFVAAASIAEKAMVDAMMEANQVQPAHTLEKYTIKQLEAIRKARDIMESAGCFVTHWQYPGMHDIVKAGIDAVKRHNQQA
jgi:hypothetical protein